jgi:hypothetical protein
MTLVTRVGRSLTRRPAAMALAVTTALVMGACSSDRGTTGPTLPPNPPGNPQFRQAAFTLDVNSRTGKVVITPPQKNTTTLAPGLMNGPDIQRSILAGDVVNLTASNFTASAVGAFQPGKIRVTFDINVTNKLSSVQLITPTFPTPPAGTNGIILFPYENVVTVTSGGVSTGGDGTDIIVEMPSHGQIAPSTDWDAAEHNFFNDTGCPVGSNDCYRHEVYTQPLAAGSTSEARTVGFDIDPTVGNFRARLIIAADLQDAGPAPTGTIAGSVTSPQLGPLAGVVVTAVTGGLTGTTNAAGAYQILSVTTGPKTVSLNNLPAGCTNPGSQNTTVTNGGTSTVNFTVTCATPTGTIGGTITSSLGGPLSGVAVTATPTGGSAVGPANTNASGVYSLASVPVGPGTGVLTFGNVPAGCTNPGPQNYSGLTNGGTLTLDFTLSCTPPPAGYNYSNSFVDNGSTVTLTISIDMGSFNDPNVNGANPDDIDAIQGDFTYNASRLQFVSCANVAGSILTNGTFNGSTPGTVSFLNFSTNPTLATGSQGIAQCTFNDLGSGASATVTTLAVAASKNGDDLLPNVLISEGNLP